MKYKILKQHLYSYGNYSLTNITMENLVEIKAWRNEQIDILRQNKKLTNKNQRNYYKKTIEPTLRLKYPNQLIFSFLENNFCIGYGGLTNIDWTAKRTEMSFLVNPIRKKVNSLYSQDLNCFFSLIRIIAFDELKLEKIFTETYDIRPFHVSILESIGFTFEGRLKNHNIINNKKVDSIMHGYFKNEL
jgi:hypothetical protein